METDNYERYLELVGAGKMTVISLYLDVALCESFESLDWDDNESHKNGDSKTGGGQAVAHKVSI